MGTAKKSTDELRDLVRENRRLKAELAALKNSGDGAAAQSPPSPLPDATLVEILESSPIGVGISRMEDSRLVYTNGPNRRMFQLSGSDEFAKDFWADPAKRREFLAAIAASDATVTDEAEMKRADGSTFWSRLSWKAISFQDEPCILFWVDDIDDLKKAQAELASQASELEAFAYSVSHDLRGPLRVIEGCSQVLIEDHGADLPSDALGNVDRVRYHARHMAALIDDLLMLSRLGRRRFAPETVDMNRLVGELVDELQTDGRLGRSKVTVGSLPPCRGDSNLLRHLFVNLLTNAVKYSALRPEPKIEVGHTGDDAGEYFVADDGIGFDMEHAGKLFGIFQRLHPTGEYEGTGIGLATVRRIVERHGGTVRAHSKPDDGATFYFTVA